MYIGADGLRWLVPLMIHCTFFFCNNVRVQLIKCKLILHKLHINILFYLYILIYRVPII